MRWRTLYRCGLCGKKGGYVNRGDRIHQLRCRYCGYTLHKSRWDWRGDQEEFDDIQNLLCEKFTEEGLIPSC